MTPDRLDNRIGPLQPRPPQHVRHLALLRPVAQTQVDKRGEDVRRQEPPGAQREGATLDSRHPGSIEKQIMSSIESRKPAPGRQRTCESFLEARDIRLVLLPHPQSALACRSPVGSLAPL